MKTTKQFDFILPLSANTGGHFNPKPELFGSLRITGIGYYCGGNDPLDYDTNEIWYDDTVNVPHDIKQLFEFLNHTTMDGADFIHDAIIAHLEGLFEQNCEFTHVVGESSNFPFNTTVLNR